ncbi:retrotransposon hot spot (RHS) protein, putative, partial [Trypanosoma cruzi]
MPPKQNRVQGGNAKSRASAVPQGGRRRAIQEFEGKRDQPSATHIRAESQQPQWTTYSYIKDILLERSTLSYKMRLNEFIRSYLGDTAAVDEDHNVTMEAFVQDPDAYVQDQQLLELILNLAAYQELKRELEERKILWEAVYKLHHEGVYFLDQWRDYEGKDTVAPLARRNLNRVLTQVLREERREAEERARRDKQQIMFNLCAKIEDLLFRGRVRVMKIKLNDFLTLEMEGRGILRANRNVLLRDFISDPTRYIREAGVLGEIQAADAYARMKGAVRDEMDMEEDVRRLYEKGVDILLKWSLAAEEVKVNVHNLTKRLLDAAFIELMSSMAMSAPIKLEGCYESVYNARWHHVVEVPGGEGTGMYVREGKPPQSWTYRAVGETLERDDGAEQSGAARLKLMVLTSDKGWPYSWEEDESTRDCYVNCEVDRVWQIVKRDLTEWFSPDAGDYFKPKRRLLIGTPGIGKSMAAGSYLLYQLLHYDVEQLPMVAYFIGSQSFLFDKTTKTLSTYRGDPGIEDVVNIFSLRGVKGYIIYDAT